jgi:hypothetical protein
VGGCCARGDEPLRSIDVRNFLISSETVSSVFRAVTNLVMMKCVCVCVCVCGVCVVCVCVWCVCVRERERERDCGACVSCQCSWCDLAATGYDGPRFTSRPLRPAVNTSILSVLLRTSRPYRNALSSGATTDSFQIPYSFLLCGCLTDVLIQLWLGV